MKNNFKYKNYKIVNKEESAPDTVLFTLVGKLKFDPGQFVQVSLPRVGEATFVPCSNPTNIQKFQLMIRACGNTTNRLVELLPGDSMLIRGPYGKGWPIGNLIGKNILIISGGLGIVPLRSLIFELLKYKKEFKKISILSGFKTPDCVLFEKDYKNIWTMVDYLKVAVEKSDKYWWGETTMITKLIKRIKLSPKDTTVLICGPEIMFKFCINELIKKKISSNSIYISFERRMECGIGICQHCNIGKFLVCKDGPIFRWDVIQPELNK